MPLGPLAPPPLAGVRRALVVAPHADDEVIGAYALIRRLRRAGAAVQVAVVSDGAASHPSSPSWPRARLTAERRRESLRALGGLGVPRAAVRFLDLPDGGLPACRSGPLAVRRLLARQGRLGLLVGPTPDDAHPDHRAVAAWLRAAPAPGVRRLAYRVWPAGAPARGRARTLPLALPLGPARWAKRRAVLSYRTQAGLITDDPRGFAMAPHEVRAFSGPLERYERVRP